MKKINIATWIIAMIILLTSQISNAANVSWNAAVSGNWNDGTKWSGGVAPTINDTAVITVAGTYTVTLNVNASIAKLVLGNASGFQLLTSTSHTLTLANASTINSHGTLELSQSTLNGAGTLTSNGKIRLIYNNIVSSNLVINDTLHITHQANAINGTFTTSATSVIYMDASASHSIVTFANGFTNNGKIHMKSATCNYNYLIVTSGVLVNPTGGIIVSDPLPNCIGYNRIDAALNNQGTMNINYSLRVYTAAGASANTGTVNFTGTNTILTYYNGTINWNGAALNFVAGSSLDLNGATLNWNSGTITGGTGQFNFESSTGNFTTAATPNVRMYFNSSTLASPSVPLTSTHLIELNYNNIISASLFNSDTIKIHHQANSVTGTYTNTATSVILMDAATSHSIITFASGFTNNGKIHMKSATCNYNYLIVTSGVLTNAAGATIVSDPLPNCIGYNRIDAALNNQGTMNINYSLRVYTSAGASANTGTVNFTGTSTILTYYNGTINWNGAALNFVAGSSLDLNGATLNWNSGTITGGTGKFNFETSTGNFTTAATPNVRMYFNSSTLASPSIPLTSTHLIELNYNNIISASVFNSDTIKIHHQANSVTGTYTNTATSVILMDAATSHSIITFASGFTNNGKIHMKSATCNYNYLIVTSGVLVNPAGGIIISDPLPNCVGYNRIDAALNNQGTMNINYSLRVYTSAGASANTGTVNFTGTNTILTYYNGTINWNGAALNFVAGSSLDLNGATLNWNSGTITGGTGQFNFESSTGNFTTAATPNVRMYFNSSTLASPMLPLTSSHLIEFNYNNTISAAVFNNDTIKIHHQANTMSGALTTATTSVVIFDAQNSHSILTVNSGFTNNGLIRFVSATCNYGYLIVSTGTMINSPSGVIQSNPLPNCVGYHRIDAALDNQGTISVNYTLRHYTSAGASHNSGVINFSNGYNLEVYNGIWNWDGGSVGSVGSSKIIFQAATARWNTSTMPSIVTYYYQSTLATSLGGINSAKKIQLSYANTVSANLNNTDTVEVMHQTNIFSGTYTNTTTSLLLFDAAESHSIMTFNNSFTNNGKIKFISATCNYGYLAMNTATLLTNSATGIIQSDPLPNCVLYHRMDAAINNLGTINVNYTLRHYTSPGASTNTGTINFSGGYNLEVYNGTWNWNGGTATSANSKIIFQATVASFNTAIMPSITTYFYQSTLATSLGGISNAKKIQLSYANTVSANLNNTDTVEVVHQNNIFSGSYTNTTTSLLLFDAAESHSIMTFNNSFTNNGKIKFISATCNYGYLAMNSGQLLTNAATGIIQSDPLPNCVLYHRMDAAINNLGTINVNYTLRHYTSPGASTNTGTINFSNGYNLEVYNGTWNWNGGTATSANSRIMFNACVANFNTAIMPSVTTYFYNTTLATSLGGISNAKKIQLSYANTVSANLNNTDTVEVVHQNNIFSGNYTNTTTSLLLFDAAESHSIMTFNNNFTNNGTLKFVSATCNYGYLIMAATKTLTNAVGANLICDPLPNCVGYHRLDGNYINNGTTVINYQLYHQTGSFVNNGTLKGGSYLNNNGMLLTNNGSIAPGSSPGKLSINANLSNKSTSIWNIEVGGLTVATQFDQVDNNYASTKDSIDGTLNISLINGFVPSLGDSVVIETHNLRVGTFATITGQNIGGGLFWNVFYRTNHIALRAGNPPNLDITSSTGANGTISPLGITSVVYNGTQTYNMIPNINYHVLDVLVDGSSVGAVTSYTFNNVTVNHTISVTFAINTWNIVATTSGNGTISPSGTVVVNQGNNQTFNLTADPCNLIDSVIVDGIYQGANSSFTFTNVVANHTIKAVFRIAPRITASGATTFCAGGSVTLDAGAGYTNYQWSNSASTQTTNITTGGTYTCTVTSTGGCTSSTSVVVTVNPLPSVSFANPYAVDANHVCVSAGGIALNGYGFPVGGGFSGNGVSYNGFGNYSFSPSGAGVGTHTLTYNYTDGNGCSNSATTNIIVDQSATANAGLDIILCNNPLANLTGAIGGSATSALWSSNGTGGFANANNLSTTYTLSAADMALGTVTLTLLTNDPANTCGAVSDILVITYNPDAVADAGPSISCVPSSNVAVSGSISGYPATPHWTTTGTGTFVNANLLSTTYNPSVADLAAQHVYLILTPIDPLGNCTFTADTLDAWFNPNYSVNAGSDVILCGINDTIATINGSLVNATSVTWITSGSGTFANANNANTTYILSASDRANGYLQLTLTTNDPTGPCTSVSDFMIVKYKYAIADAGVDVCGDTTTVVSGSAIANTLASSTLNVLWTTTGTGNFTNANSYSAIYNASNADLASGQTKIYFNLIDGAGDCTYGKDSMVIWYNPHYSVGTATDTATFCANAILNISGSSVNTLSTTWSTSGTGTFGNANLLSTTYTPSSADTTAGFVTLTLTSNNPNGPCGAVSDNMYVIIHSAPDASAGNNTPICNGTDLNLTASGGTSYAWTGPNSFTSSQQNIVIPNSTVAMSGTYTVVVSNNFGCSNPANTVVIVNPCGCIAPTLLQSHVDVTCFGGSDGSIDLTAVGGSGGNTFLWSNSATTEDVSGLTAGTYTVTVTAAGGCTAGLTVTISQPAIPLPPITITANGPTTICNGSNVVLDAGAGFVSYAWSNGITTQTNTIATAGSYTVTATNGAGCTASSASAVTVTVVNAPPATNVVVPPIIGLPSYACNGQVNSISVPAVVGATDYIWDGPAGTSFNGGNNPFTNSTPTANITFGNANGSGYYIGVQAANVCGATQRKVQWVRGTLSVPASVIGNVMACENSSATYSTGAIIGAVSYLWTISGDANINGSGTSVVTTSLSVTVNFGAAWTGGTLCVASQTPCYTSPSKCLGITKSAAPLGVINGTFTACPGNTFTYNVTAVAGAANYSWTLPPGASGSSTSNSIAVTFGVGFYGGDICVNVTSTCGIASAYRCKTIYSGVPAVPSSVTGPTNGMCGQTAVFTCPSQSGVTYNWTSPSGSTINSGQGTNAMSVTFGTFATGQICVSAQTTCGASIPRCITVKGAPNTPASITATPTSWCANTSGIQFDADVSNLSGSYLLNWNYPSSTVATYVLGGGNSTSLILDWGTGNGTVSVTASNACGNATKNYSAVISCREGAELTNQNQTSKSNISVYPNPAHDFITISFSSDKEKVCVIELMDMTGKKVISKKINSYLGNNTSTIDVRNFAKGIYFINLISETSSEKKKVVIE